MQRLTEPHRGAEDYTGTEKATKCYKVVTNRVTGESTRTVIDTTKQIIK